LKAELGYIAILHTWGQNLQLHPHIHCIVPGGGLWSDGTRWIATRKNFLVSVRVLSKRFRTLFTDALQDAFENGKLEFHGKLKHLANPNAFGSWLRSTRATEWVVHAKPPFGGPEQTLRYIGRYTHRVAISNHRLKRVTDDQVTFDWKSYRTGQTHLLMNLHPHEFMRRFLLHVLPHRFVRIRYGGFLAHRHRRDKLALCRRLLHTSLAATTVTTAPNAQAGHSPYADTPAESTGNMKTQKDSGMGRRPRLCPTCKHGHMHPVAIIPSLVAPTKRRRRLSGRSPPVHLWTT
jgi:hypothetical protein